MDIKLIIFRPDGTKKVVPLTPGTYVMGRHENATLRVPLPSVSREHCELQVDARGLKVRDLGSSNGTFCNSQRVREAGLNAGDILGVGELQIVVQIDGRPSEPSIKSAGAPALGASGASQGSSIMDAPPVLGGASGAKTAAVPTKPMVPPDDEDDTTPRPGGPPSLGPGSGDDSSLFDFDFDLEDKDRPQL